MHLTRRGSIALIIVSLILCIFQAEMWAKATSHAPTETVTQNKEFRHETDTVPGVAGLALLFLTGVLVTLQRVDLHE